MKIKTLIVDDEKASRTILRSYLLKYCPSIDIIGEAENIDAADALIKQHTIDLIFLDIEMPRGNAFDLLQRLETYDFAVIFVTAYEHYAIEAVNAHASYYLLKPISIDHLIEAVEYVSDIRNKESLLTEGLVGMEQSFTQGKLTLPTKEGFEVVNSKDILYCKADDNYTHIYYKSNKTQLISKTLKYFDEALNAHGFVRIHKSYLINIDAVTAYQKGKGGMVVLSNGQSLSVSASQKAKLLAYFK